MASPLPSHTLRRVKTSNTISITSCTKQQTRHASLLRRPHRPYTFTQLVTLSDGSTYTARTTSPLPIFRSTKDSRNSPLWQPSLLSLKNVEQDEAGRLRAFRRRFGRGWDVDADLEAEEGGEMVEGGQVREREESLMDLIGGSAYGQNHAAKDTGVEEKEVEMIMVKRDGVLVKVPKKEEKPKGAPKKK